LFKSWQVFVFSLVPLALVFTGVIVGSMHGLDSSLQTFPTQAPQAQSTAGPAPTAAPGTTAIQLVAKNITFDQTSLSASAGNPVSITFDNQDAGVLHNFSLYADKAHTQAVFKGDLVTGVASTTYTFDAPSTPGTYYFHCDVHPDQMQGVFVVK
jgi:plastocyanin